MFTLRRTPATSTLASRFGSSTTSRICPGIARHIAGLLSCGASPRRNVSLCANASQTRPKRSYLGALIRDQSALASARKSDRVAADDHRPPHPGGARSRAWTTRSRVLKAEGLRVSAARRLLVEALFAAGGPVTAEQIAAGSGGRVPESDVGSVYRNLELLERVGLVRHAHLGHGPAVYALAGQARPGLPDLRALRRPARAHRPRARAAAPLDPRRASATRRGFATSRSPASARPAPLALRTGTNGVGRPVSFDSLFAPVEHARRVADGLFEGAPLLVALGLARRPRAAPCLRPRPPGRGHVAGRQRRCRLRRAAHLGAWWGLGHARCCWRSGCR